MLAVLTAAGVAVAVDRSASAGSSGASQTGKRLSISKPDYVGRFRGHPGRVLIRISRGGTQRVTFEARRFEERCEDFGVSTASVEIYASIDDDGTFQAVDSSASPGTGDLGYFSLASGKLEGNRAGGYFIALDDAFDTPGSSENLRECWTKGPLRWRARKVKGGKSVEADPQPRRLAQDYRGELRFSRGSQVEVELRESAGKDRLRFEARFRLACEGFGRDPGRQVRIAVGGISVSRAGQFEAAVFRQRQGSRDRRFTWIEGRAGGRNRLTGSFAHFEDPLDPAPGPNRAECGTFPRYRWSATRTN